MKRFFIGKDRLEERGERVKGKNKFILRESGKVRIHWGKRGKTTGGENDWRKGKRGKTRLAKGYLGLQGTGDESGAMDESKEPLSGR